MPRNVTLFLELCKYSDLSDKELKGQLLVIIKEKIQLDLRDPNINNSGDMSNYHINGEFKLEAFNSEYHLEYYSCCEEPYPDITYTIR